MKKKVVGILLCAALAATTVLTGCGGSDSSSKDTVSASDSSDCHGMRCRCSVGIKYICLVCK